MLSIFVLLLISILPVCLIGMYIYSKDMNKEPKMLLLLLIRNGIISCFLTIFITNILSIFFPILLIEDVSNLNYFELFLYVFLGIALIEEFSKWIMLYSVSFKNRYFDEIFDMIVYSTFVALGFALYENILYVMSGGVITGLLRAVTAIPGHACDGIIMGYFLSLAKLSILKFDNKGYIKNVVLSILAPTILHGIYDYCLYSNNIYLIVFFIVFLIFMYVFVYKLIKKLSKTVNLFYKNNFCSNCGSYIKEDNFCGNCGKKISG